MSQPTSRRALWTQKIADQVADTLARRIRDGRLEPGKPLPPRETLASEFVTVAGIVDRALETLEDRGLVVRGPDGAVVADLPVRAGGFRLPASETTADVLSILEMRLGLEAVSAALAARRHTASEMRAIEQARDAFEAECHAGGRPAQADFHLHRAIAEASGNPYLRDLLDYLGPLLIPRMRMALPRSSGRADVNLARSVEEHRALVAAIAARDAEKARHLMRAHLLRTIALIDPAWSE